jgi:hypothetical protein
MLPQAFAEKVSAPGLEIVSQLLQFDLDEVCLLYLGIDRATKPDDILPFLRDFRVLRRLSRTRRQPELGQPGVRRLKTRLKCRQRIIQFPLDGWNCEEAAAKAGVINRA